MFCGHVVYPAHGSYPRPFDLSPLRDQELAGTIMWVAVTLIYVVPAMAVTMRLLSPFATEPDADVMSTPHGPVWSSRAGG